MKARIPAGGLGVATRLEDEAYPTGAFETRGLHLAKLTKDMSQYTLPAHKPASKAHVDCIVVPTSRAVGRGRHIRAVFELAREHGAAGVLILCSGAAKKEELIRIASQYGDLSWSVVDGPFLHEYDNFHTTQSLIAYGEANDLAQKRNLALRLARMLGWRYVFFMDDDVTVPPNELAKVAELLKNGASVVGFSVRDFPDHSVAVHASRWVKNTMVDSFIGGGVMGVDTSCPHLPFFPHVYNDDWLFFLPYCLLDDGLVWAGTIKQRRYNPFKTVTRAINEEPGDLLAESLMRLALSMKSDRHLSRSFDGILEALYELANESFWQQEINERVLFIRTTQDKVRSRRMSILKRRQVLRSLKRSLTTLVGERNIQGLRAGDLAAWVRDWIDDLRAWDATLVGLPSAANIGAALEYLELQNSVTCHQAARSGTREEITHRVDKLPPELESLPVIIRSENWMRGLYTTKIIQDFLKTKKSIFQVLDESNARLRFDRPGVNCTVPVFSVAILVAEGESFRLVSEAIRTIREYVDIDMPLQVAVWVYGFGGRSHVEAYRNRLIARLVPEIRGTNVLLRSGILHSGTTNLDRQIDEIVGSMALAYWMSEIEGDDHSVYVVNSRGELLRRGTLWEFLRQEHTMPSRPLKAYLKELNVPGPFAPLSRKDVDEQSVRQSRQQLANGGLKRRRLTLPSFSATTRLSIGMRRAGLTWLELDDIAHEFTFTDRSIRVSGEKVLCLPVAFHQGLKSDLQASARHIVEMVASSKATHLLECMVVVYASPDIKWTQLQAFRSELMHSITTEYQSADVVFCSVVCHSQYASNARQAKAVGSVVIRYRHWLETYEVKKISV